MTGRPQGTAPVADDVSGLQTFERYLQQKEKRLTQQLKLIKGHYRL